MDPTGRGLYFFTRISPEDHPESMALWGFVSTWHNYLQAPKIPEQSPVYLVGVELV